MAQPGQDQTGAQGLAPHESQHQQQPQGHKAPVNPAQNARQTAQGLVPQKEHPGGGHQQDQQAHAQTIFALLHHTRTPLSAARAVRMCPRLSPSSWALMARMLPDMSSRASSS